MKRRELLKAGALSAIALTVPFTALTGESEADGVYSTQLKARLVENDSGKVFGPIKDVFLKMPERLDASDRGKKFQTEEIVWDVDFEKQVSGIWVFGGDVNGKPWRSNAKFNSVIGVRPGDVIKVTYDITVD